MAKTIISVQNGRKGQKKFKVKKGPKNTEKDVGINITSAATDQKFVVEQLELEGLDAQINGQDIVWFNNFSIKKKKKDGTDGDPINQAYKVTIEGLGALRSAGKNIVLQGAKANNGKAYIFTGAVNKDTIELTDGDPAVGGCPP